MAAARHKRTESACRPPALRLVIAAGTAAAGICLVLALIVLVVRLGAAGAASTGSRRPIIAATAKKTAGEGVELDIAGPTGQGITWNTGGGGLHYLNVSSACSWTARVVVPRPPKRNS
jgi:hypothetical protein